MDLQIVLAGVAVGFVVGLTGMGGGALMTPILVFFFNIDPFTAVSSDLVTSAIMKPVGGAVHMRQGTVHWPLVRWLMVGSVPFAFAGVFALKALGGGDDVQLVVKTALGVALLVAAAGLVVKSVMASRRAGTVDDRELVVKPLPTVLVGAVGGLVVGMTSVGSGSLIIIALMALYPMLRTNRLVGTDLVQAVPLVASAAVAHMLFGEFQLDLTLSLLIGALPAVYLGSKVSSFAPDTVIRPALTVVLVASAMKLLGAPTEVAVAVLVGAILVGSIVASVAWWRKMHKMDPVVDGAPTHDDDHATIA